MKRMNELFELPVDGYALRDTIFYKTSGADDEIIAHAINNVDTLADALENLIDTMQHDYWVYFKCSNPESAELAACRQLFDLSHEGVSLKSKTADAVAALNAYRGAK